MSAAPAPQHARGGRGSPLLLLFPLAFAAGLLWWVREGRESGLPTRPPEREDPETAHDVLGGELGLDGATLSSWLAPSEPDPARQAFQSKALRKRYGLPEGEIWRLRLELRREPSVAGAPAPGALDVAQVAVQDDAGSALSPLELARELDPLAALLAAPSQPLAPGTGIDLFLWGRAPGAGARVIGLGAEAQGLALRPRSLRLAELAGPLARLDPASPRPNESSDGKTAPAGASKAPVRGRDDARY